jgi:hypothetical protein
VNKSKNKNHNEEIDLLARSNLGLVRLLVVVNAAGPQGISTNRLLQQLNSSNHAQAFIRRAAKKGLIERIEGKSEHGHFAAVYNKLTERGRDLLLRQLTPRTTSTRTRTKTRAAVTKKQQQ